jgi:hypothetical protein
MLTAFDSACSRILRHRELIDGNEARCYCKWVLNLTSVPASLIIAFADGGDRLRQGFGRPTDDMPGYLMQLVKTRREKTIANNNQLALAA